MFISLYHLTWINFFIIIIIIYFFVIQAACKLSNKIEKWPCNKTGTILADAMLVLIFPRFAKTFIISRLNYT